MKLRCKDQLSALQKPGDSLDVSNSRAESLRWCANYEMRMTVKTHRIGKGQTRVTLVAFRYRKPVFKGKP